MDKEFIEDARRRAVEALLTSIETNAQAEQKDCIGHNALSGLPYAALTLFQLTAPLPESRVVEP